MSARLAQRQAQLAAADIELAGLRTELDTLSEVEQGLRDAEAERELLTARLTDLTKARERAEQLPAVRERLAAVKAAVAATAAEDADTMARLTEGIRQLSALTARQKKVLGAQLEQAIAEMAAADEALARQQARIERLKADQASLEEESTALTESFGHELDALGKWRQADADLTDALDTVGAPAAGSNLDRLRGILTDLDTRLANIDSRLRPLLEARTRAREEALRVRNLSDHHAGLQGWASGCAEGFRSGSTSATISSGSRDRCRVLCHGPGDHRRVSRECHCERDAGRVRGLRVAGAAGQHAQQRVTGRLSYGSLLFWGGLARRLAVVGGMESQRYGDHRQVAAGVFGDLVGETDRQVVPARGHTPADDFPPYLGARVTVGHPPDQRVRFREVQWRGACHGDRDESDRAPSRILYGSRLPDQVHRPGNAARIGGGRDCSRHRLSFVRRMVDPAGDGYCRRVIADGAQAPDGLGECPRPLSLVLDIGGQFAGTGECPPGAGKLADGGLCPGEHG